MLYNENSNRLSQRGTIMAVQRVADMTLDELNQLIEQAVERQLRLVKMEGDEDTRSMDEINDSIRRHRWTPPPGAKSSLELLREDRDA
jgi:hypothetical protein